MVGLNPHGEITSMHFPGPVMLDKLHIRFCINNAFQRAKSVAELVEKRVEEDLQKRKIEVHPKGFVDKLISDERLRCDTINAKVSTMKALSSQFRKVREMIDVSEKQQLTELQQQVKMEEGDSNNSDNSADSSSSSDDSSDSEFDDTENNVLVPTVHDNEDSAVTILNGKCEKQLIIKQEDSDEEVQPEKVNLGDL